MRQGAQIGLGELPISDTELQAGFNLLNGRSISAADTKTIVTSRLKGYLSGKLKDRLTEGTM
ncbi:MAG TPA: hypothetical protein PKM41_07790 [Deltaproteobacteria bacterium]|jgi:hypothetical protein|nr:hypothetical protein [Deltaproteobacteria bacterium]